MYINLRNFIIRGHRGQLQTSKVTRGKKLVKPTKKYFCCMYTQTSIRGHIGYVRLTIDVIGGHFRTHQPKNRFSKEVKKSYCGK